ncbi:MAG: hypothetical protein WAV90_09740 [Gordonia amarae]
MSDNRHTPEPRPCRHAAPDRGAHSAITGVQGVGKAYLHKKLACALTTGPEPKPGQCVACLFEESRAKGQATQDR